MKFTIKHEAYHRMRIHLSCRKMTFAEADILQYYLQSAKMVKNAKVYEKTADAVIEYVGDREQVITLMREFHYEDVEVPTGLIENSGREMNAEYKERMIQKVLLHYAGKIVLPYPVRAGLVAVRSVYLLSARILIRRVRLFSCWALVSFWRSGPTRNLWMIWPEVCL